jgi:hypothetical protein
VACFAAWDKILTCSTLVDKFFQARTPPTETPTSRPLQEERGPSNTFRKSSGTEGPPERHDGETLDRGTTRLRHSLSPLHETIAVKLEEPVFATQPPTLAHRQQFQGSGVPVEEGIQASSIRAKPKAKKPSTSGSSPTIPTLKRAGSHLTQPRERRPHSAQSHPRFPGNIAINGLQVSVILPELIISRDANATLPTTYSDAAKEMGKPDMFLPAVAQTLQYALNLIRNTDLMPFIKDFSWERHHQMPFNVIQNDRIVDWDSNLTNVKHAAENADTAMIDFRYLEYQQRWRSAAEVELRVTNGKNRGSAERKVLSDIGERLSLTDGLTSSAKTKSRNYLRNLFKINSNYVAFIISRGKKDKWRSILRGEHGNIDTALIQAWTELVGPACQHVWCMLNLLKTKQTGSRWKTTIKSLFLERDAAAGVTYTESQKKAWTFDEVQRKDVATATGFKAKVSNRSHPDLVGQPRPNGAEVTPRPGSFEWHAFVGDQEKFRSHALVVIYRDGAPPTMVSIVDLKEGDYLGMIPGTLHRTGNYGHSHELCFAGPDGITLDPVPSPLWLLLATRELQQGNVVIMWQAVTRVAGLTGDPADDSSFEFHAFASTPISALEPLVIDSSCMVGNWEGAGPASPAESQHA